MTDKMLKDMTFGELQAEILELRKRVGELERQIPEEQSVWNGQFFRIRCCTQDERGAGHGELVVQLKETVFQREQERGLRLRRGELFQFVGVEESVVECGVVPMKMFMARVSVGLGEKVVPEQVARRLGEQLTAAVLREWRPQSALLRGEKA